MATVFCWPTGRYVMPPQNGGTPVNGGDGIPTSPGSRGQRGAMFLPVFLQRDLWLFARAALTRRGRAGTEAKDPKGHQGPPPSQLEERTQEVTWSPGSLSGSLLSRSPCSYFWLPSGSLCPGAGRSSHSNPICEGREVQGGRAGGSSPRQPSPRPR